MATYVDIIATEIASAGWSYSDAVECTEEGGCVLYVATAYKDGYQCVARAETLQTAFMELREMTAKQDRE